MKFSTRCSIALLTLPALFLTACTADQVTTSLELAVDAALAAAPAIEQAAGVAPDTQQAVSGYLALTQTCLVSAESVLSAGRPVASAAAAVADACSANALQSPVLPSGTPSNVVSAVNAVAKALSVFLNSVPKSAAIYLSHPEFASGFAGKPAKAKADKKRLARIRRKLEKLKRQAHNPGV